MWKSQPGYYFNLGDPKRFKIHLEGGGFCETDADCEARSNTTLGSSSFWPPVANTDKAHFPGQWNLGLDGLLGSDAHNGFGNWTAVFVMCNSAGTQTLVTDL